MPTDNYTIYTGNAYRGQESDASTPRVNGTGIAEADLEFGIALERGNGTIENGVKFSTGGNVFGVAIREANHEADTRPSDGTTSYKTTNSVSIMREGYINVQNTGAAAMAIGVLANVVDTTGEFTGDAVAAGIVASTNVVAMETIAAGEVGRVRIDIVA